MAKLNELTISVKVDVQHETARACFHILKMYCQNIRGDLEPSPEGCSGCVLWMSCPLLDMRFEEGEK